MGKKNKKKKCLINEDNEYDYSDINYNGDIRKFMTNIADSIEVYIDFIETYAIFEGITEDAWKQNMKIAKKLIKKLRKGDPSVFNISKLNEVISSNHKIIIGLE